MKKIISIVLLISICFSCFSTSILAETQNSNQEQTVSKVRYYYLDNDNATMTEDSSVFEQNIGVDDEIEVVLELDYTIPVCNCKKEISECNTDAEINDVLIQHRNEIKRINYENNLTFMDEHNITEASTDYSIMYSHYSPYIILFFDSYSDYSEYDSSILSLANEDSVTGINIGVPIGSQSSATRVSKGSVPTYPIEDAISDIDASDQTYNGTGIKIGIIEAEGIAYSSSNSDLNDLTIYTNGETVSNHAVNVTRALCGSRGVARNVDSVYIYHSSSISSMPSAMDWMVANGCNIVNISKSTEGLNGQYHWTSAMLDYYICYYWITCIVSAGNNGEATDHNVSNYAMGNNVIAVASTDSRNNISTFSSYGVDDNIYSRKPTIAAPGTKMICGSSTLNGTSFAAPMVAGVVAKLMDEFYELTAYPEIVAAVLIASATKVNGQSSDWDTDAGAGRVNYSNARGLINTNNCISFSNTTDSLGTKFSQTIAVTPGKNIKFVFFGIVNSETRNSSYSVATNSYTDYDLKIYNNSINELAASVSLTNIEYIYYCNQLYTTIEIEIIQYTPLLSDNEEYAGIVWSYE